MKNAPASSFSTILRFIYALLRALTGMGHLKVIDADFCCLFVLGICVLVELWFDNRRLIQHIRDFYKVLITLLRSTL